LIALEKSEAVAKITASLTLGGQDFDPEIFTRIAGREPSEIWRPKVPQKSNPDFPQIEWSYSQIKQPRWSIDEAIRELLDNFSERRNQMVAFANQFGCSFHLSLTLYGDQTVIVYRVERETTDLIASFGCSISLAIDLN
jgi:hypothetical protein